jgi:hypothetical protein
MSSKVDQFLAKTLGEDFFESLQKVELWKQGTRTTIDHEELRTALQIVPRTVMALLIRELTPMNIGENKEIHLFVGGNALLRVTKHERDVYSGEIEQDNKKIAEFKYRAIPGVGLVILSAFELYDMNTLADHQNEDLKDGMSEKIQKLIDERLALHDLVGKVVDQRLMQKDAVHQLVLQKLTEAIHLVNEKVDNLSTKTNVAMATAEVANHKVEEMKKLKGSPLKDFLEARKNKARPKEFVIEMAKGENVTCPDCQKNIFDGQIFSGCICLGDDMERKVFIKKTEEGIKVRFSKGWDQENIEMLLEVLRRKRG